MTEKEEMGQKIGLRASKNWKSREQLVHVCNLIRTVTVYLQFPLITLFIATAILFVLIHFYLPFDNCYRKR